MVVLIEDQPGYVVIRGVPLQPGDAVPGPDGEPIDGLTVDVVRKNNVRFRHGAVLQGRCLEFWRSIESPVQ